MSEELEPFLHLSIKSMYCSTMTMKGITLILFSLGIIYTGRGCTDEVYRALSWLIGLYCLIWGLAMCSWLVQLAFLMLVLLVSSDSKLDRKRA